MITKLKQQPLRIVLYEPQIPPNTGNIARTCAAFKLELCLIEPLGFSLEDKYLRRAGLDYWKHVNVTTYKSIGDFLRVLPINSRIIGCSKFGGSNLSEFTFQHGDVLLFGREDTGLPLKVRNKCNNILTIPMRGGADNNDQNGVRSLNISVACAIVTYHAGLKLNLW